ncbi:MAG: hypothetical protein DI551_01975 [Micavibrio aeruginosavorus]|uniref:VTT domain-containing protein n=1 Tax=Micavibrio aeruginosavorus TaxID=349221 RepID=A0A2W5N7G1_9BACT|nr:MAG: hypothetical protein DI551_01975 [Micavibrio aeruginosavorus]
MMAYGGLFLASFIAATIFPAQSEAVLTALLLNGGYSPWLLVAVASVGNVWGSCVNWALGRGIDHFHDRPWFPLKSHMRQKAQCWYQRYGKWSLLLSWVPFIGDPITVMAGVMKEKWWVFLSLVALAKTGRYMVLAAIVLQLV